MTGVRYGGYDLRWAAVVMTIAVHSDRLAFQWKVVSAVEAVSGGAYHTQCIAMFISTKSVLAGEGMLSFARQRAKDSQAQDALIGRGGNHFHKGLSGQANDGLVLWSSMTLLHHCFTIWTIRRSLLASLCKDFLSAIFRTASVARSSRSSRHRDGRGGREFDQRRGWESRINVFLRITALPTRSTSRREQNAATRFSCAIPMERLRSCVDLTDEPGADMELAFRTHSRVGEWSLMVESARSAGI